MVSSESLFLGQASVVKLLVATLQYLQAPANSVAAAHLWLEYLRYIRLQPDTHVPFEDMLPDFTMPSEEEKAAGDAWPQEHKTPAKDKQQAEHWHHLLRSHLPARLTEETGYLSSLPLYELCETLTGLLGLNKDEKHLINERAYLQAFLDEVLAFEMQADNDLTAFLEWWEDKGQTRSVQTPAQSKAAKILTIHKSKGLQAKVVIVPFCNWGLDHGAFNENILWTQPTVAPFDELDTLPIRYGSSLCGSLFEPDYRTEQVKASLDSLNMLYVATTRAESELYLLAEKAKPNAKGEWPLNNVSDLLTRLIVHPTEALLNRQNDYNSETQLFSQGNKPTYVDDETKKKDKSPEILSAFPVTGWRQRLAVRSQAADFFKRTKDQTTKLHLGGWLKTIIGEMHTADELQQALYKATGSGKLPVEQRFVAEQQMQKILNHETMAGWFDKRWTVRNNASILTAKGRHLRIGRLMIHSQTHEAVAVGFVSGQPDPYLQKDLKNSLGTLKELGYEKVSGYFVDLSVGHVELVKGQ